MANVIQCDRCGRTYQPADNTVVKFVRANGNDPTGKSKKTESRDLCRECYEDFLCWVADGRSGSCGSVTVPVLGVAADAVVGGDAR